MYDQQETTDRSRRSIRRPARKRAALVIVALLATMLHALPARAQADITFSVDFVDIRPTMVIGEVGPLGLISSSNGVGPITYTWGSSEDWIFFRDHPNGLELVLGEEAQPGTYTIEGSATEVATGTTVSGAYEFQLDPALSGDAIETDLDLPDRLTHLGDDVEFQLNRHGNFDSSMWSVQGLPPGITVSRELRLAINFEGTPAEPGTYDVLVCEDYDEATPSCQYGSKFTWTVSADDVNKAPVISGLNDRIVAASAKPDSHQRIVDFELFDLAANPIEVSLDPAVAGFEISHDHNRGRLIALPEAALGAYDLVIRTTDSSGASSTTAVTWDISSNVAGLGDTEVQHVVSCLAGNGRVDTNIVNLQDPASYRVEFEGVTARQNSLETDQWWRQPITGRFDGDYQAIVKRDGVVVSDETVTVDCDNGAPATPHPEVSMTSACADGNDYIVFQFVNPTDEPKPYVISVNGYANRSTTAAAYGQATRALVGTVYSDRQVVITSGGEIVTTTAIGAKDCLIR